MSFFFGLQDELLKLASITEKLNAALSGNPGGKAPEPENQEKGWSPVAKGAVGAGIGGLAGLGLFRRPLLGALLGLGGAGALNLAKHKQQKTAGIAEEFGAAMMGPALAREHAKGLVDEAASKAAPYKKDVAGLAIGGLAGRALGKRTALGAILGLGAAHHKDIAEQGKKAVEYGKELANKAKES